MSTVKLKGNPSGAGSVTIQSPATATDRTVTLPDADGNFVIDGQSNVSFAGDFSVDTDTLHVDSTNNRVGIGTASPARKLDVLAPDGVVQVARDLSTPNFQGGNIHLSAKDNSNAVVPYASVQSIIKGNVAGSHNGDIVLNTASSGILTEAMRIDSSGRVGIGETNPDRALVIKNSSPQIKLIDSDAVSGATDYSGWLDFVDSLGARAGYVGFGSTGNDELDIVNNSGDGSVRLMTQSIERARVDASGTFMVGKSTSASATTTIGAQIGANGSIYATSNASTPLTVSRRTDDGAIIALHGPVGFTGKLGTHSSTNRLFIASDSGTGGGIRFDSQQVSPVTKDGASSDNVYDFGMLSARWNDVYATNGTIQTSDANEKQDIAELDAAEQRVAHACKGLLRKFRWKDAVAEKGDDARIHFGIIAQDLKAAFEAEGLDAGRYAMFISSTWTDEETGEERTRMGVRYPELLAFIIAAL